MTPVPVQPQPPIDTVPAPTVSGATPKKRNYLSWILGIVVLVVILATSFLILTGKSKSIPTESLIQPLVLPEQTTVADTDIDMSSWKTYINDKDGYSIKYPPTYRHTFLEDVNKNEPEGSAIKLLNRDLYTEGESRIAGGVTGDYIEISIYPDSGDSWSEIPAIDSSTDTVIFGGQQALRKKMIFITIGPIKYNGKIYKIQYDIPYGKSESNNFYAMLSTFKFIDTNTNKINLILPTGWTKSVEQAISPFDDREKYEQTVLVKGNYKIEIGDPVGGGRANCDMEEPAPTILDNPSLSSKVKRTNPENSSGATNLQICSNLGFNDDLDYGTKIGIIRYMLPANWSQMVLKEMDSIVESITLVK